MPPYTQLNGIGNTRRHHALEVLHENLKEFYNWGLLEAGYFTNIQIGDIASNLKLLASPNIFGSAWQAPYANWVYESGLESSYQPISVSGVYINGSVTNDVDFIDYKNGIVYLNSVYPANTEVQVSYAYKEIAIYDDNAPWFRKLVLDAFDYLQPGSEKEVLDKDGVHLPCMIIESVPSRSSTGRELGNSIQRISQDFIFHVIAEDKTTRNNLVDIVSGQIDKPIRIFDINKRSQDGLFNLDEHNSPTGTGMFYNNLVSSSSPYLLRVGVFTGMAPQSVSSYLPFHRAVIKATITIDNF